MTSREKFEAFLVSEYEWGNDALNAANFHGDDATGYYTGGNFIYDGQSCSEGLFWAWRGWQAAELASEQKLTDMAVQLANAESKCRELAAENGVKQEFIKTCFRAAADGGSMDGDDIQKLGERLGLFGREIYQPVLHGYICGHEAGEDTVYVMKKTPATDAFLAEVRAQAHNEGAHFVANRMLAAWDAGFIDDTAKNSADIARMILASTEFMAAAPEGDFDRSFADGVLEDIAVQLRKGASL